LQKYLLCSIRETEEAMRESLAIASGKTKAKSYASADELFKELDRKIQQIP